MSLAERPEYTRGKRGDRFFFPKGDNFAKVVPSHLVLNNHASSKDRLFGLEEHRQPASKDPGWQSKKIKVVRSQCPPTNQMSSYSGRFESKSNSWVSNPYAGPQSIQTRLKSRDRPHNN